MRVYQFRHIRGIGRRRPGADTRTILDGRRYPSPIRRVATLAAALLAALGLAGTASGTSGGGDRAAGRTVQVVVELQGSPATSRSPSLRVVRERSLAALQQTFERRLREQVPRARVRWRYRLVLNGLAVVLPASDLPRLAAVPGVARVHRSVRYRAALDSTPAVIAAPALWGTGLANGGRGMRIAVIDDGIDPAHRFFRSAGLTAPEGFPRGDRRFTNGRIIVARAFPPPGFDDPSARLPFDRERSEHGTHVAGIAAGAAGTVVAATGSRPELTLSGVAPLAYLGNYRALTVDTASGVGLNGNAPEIVAAIEAAVRDGMDVINLSLGQPEIAPERDLVATALEAAAAQGVVPVVAAGNDFLELGSGSLASPGTSSAAITVAAVSGERAFGEELVVREPDVPAQLARLGVVRLAVSEAGLPRSSRLVAAATATADPSLCSRSGLAHDALEGLVVVVEARGCPPARKSLTADRAGAAGLLLVSDRIAAVDALLHDLAVPTAAIPAADGLALAAYLVGRGAPAAAAFTGEPASVLTSGAGVVAPFSSEGPTPVGLQLKPDVAAPGVEVVSSLPARSGRFGTLSGTSMATPHVAGAVALLLERHPDWTPQQVKAALVGTGRDVRLRPTLARLAPVTRVGGGLIDLVAADRPLVLASPHALGFGLVEPGSPGLARSIALTDAGGGAGEWRVSIRALDPWHGVTLDVPATVAVPGALTVGLSVRDDAAVGARQGWIVLERDGATRRVPFWAEVVRPALSGVPARRLTGTGTYEVDTAGGTTLVTRYRFPQPPGAVALRGPERAFRLRLARPVANVGVAVLSHDPGVVVTPRIVAGTDENRLTGASALPFVGNPYLLDFGERRPVVAALRPAAGTYTIVFDSTSPRTAGRVTFRLWVDDTQPPLVRLPSRSVRDGRLSVLLEDEGAGVDPRSLTYRLEEGPFIPVEHWRAATGEAIVDLSDVPPGRYRLTISASDRQEAKNTENAGSLLANTTVLKTMIVVGR